MKMKENKFAEILDKAKEVLSHVNIKIYLYAIASIAIIVVILINITSPSKYGTIKKDGKFYLNIEKIASDYGIDLNNQNSSSDSYIDNTDKNLTQDLSQSLYLTNLYLEQNGMSDPTARGKILKDIIFNYQSKLTGKEYTKSDISIVREENKDNLQGYYEDIKNALSKYKSNFVLNDYSKSNPANTTELVVIKNKVITDTEKNIKITDEVVSDLLSIPATERGATYQLGLINLFAKQSVYLQSLNQLDSDPAKYILLNGDKFIENYSKELKGIDDSFSNYFKEFGIK